MAIAIKDFEMPNTCGDCPYCIYTADEKRYIGYCNTSDDDYFCKALDRFMEYDKVDGGVDILGKPSDCPLVEAIPKAEIKKFLEEVIKDVNNNVLAIVREDYIHKSDYENRLKADKVAMLEDLKADIEAKTNYYEKAYKEPSNLIHETAMCGRMFGCGECEEVIQQKINELKGVQDED